MEGLISTLVWAALIQGVFLAGLYLFSKKYQSLANRLLGFFLLVIVYEGILAFQPYTSIGDYSIYYFGLPVVKLFYPVLFIHYVLEKVGRTKAYRRFLQIHYVLAILVASIFLINLGMFLTQGQSLEERFGEEQMELLYMLEQYYAWLLIIVVFGIAIFEVRRYKKIVRSGYSDYQMLNINWLWSLIFVLFPIIIVWGINLVYIALGGKNSLQFELVTWAFVIVFLYFVSFQAFKHKNLFEGVDDGSDISNGNGDTEGGHHSDALASYAEEPEENEQIQRIRRHMETQEPYLDASLSIYQLARQLKMPVRELSQLINHTLNQHFFDFVNEYRVKKAMKILRDPEQEKMTVLEILYEVGFNSKSSFNTVFKKYTGKTPTQYRKAGLVEVE
jgi:AraC-like DNA-binding protein